MSLGISQKCKAIALSATFTIDAKANAMRTQGIDVIAFGAGEPDFDTPERIRDAVKDDQRTGRQLYLTKLPPVTQQGNPRKSKYLKE